VTQQVDLRARHRLAPEQLRWTCDPSVFAFQTTAELKADEVIVGQDRAVRALGLGLTMNQPGYHIYVTGPVGTGRATYTRKQVQAVAATMPAPPDWCYVYNFQQPDQPVALSLPPGTGGAFRKEMAELVDELKDAIRKLLASETFETRRTELLQSFETRINEIWRELESKAAQLGFAIQRTPSGIATTPVGPSGEPISQEQFAALPEAQREEIARRGRELNEEVGEALRKVRAVEREAREALPGALLALMRDVGIPNGLTALGYGERDVPALVEGTLKQPRLLSGSPRAVGATEIAGILHDSLRCW